MFKVRRPFVGNKGPTNTAFVIHAVAAPPAFSTASFVLGFITSKHMEKMVSRCGRIKPPY